MKPLANRRICETIRFTCGQHHYFGTLGYFGEIYQGGFVRERTPREVFLDGGKVGSSLQAVCRDLGIILSKAIEHGTPIEEMRAAITRLDDGSPASPCGRLLDIIAEAA